MLPSPPKAPLEDAAICILQAFTKLHVCLRVHGADHTHMEGDHLGSWPFPLWP